MLAITGFPDWQREYFRLLRRERYTYERDAKHRLMYAESPEAIPDGKCEADEIVTRLTAEQAISGLDESDRELLYAVYYEGRTLAAIARETGTAYRTLGYRHDRALRKARRTLGK